MSSAPFSLTVQVPDRALTGMALKENAEIAHSQLVQRSNAQISIPMSHCRPWDNLHINLPNAASSDDMGLVTGTAGTHFPKITAGDVKAAGSLSRKFGFLTAVPPNFDTLETLAVRLRAAVETTVADTSCSLDVSAYSSDGDGTSSADLITTAAQSMNSLTPADYDFQINTASLTQGQEILVVVTVTSVDAATVTAVTPAIYGVKLLADLRG